MRRNPNALVAAIIAEIEIAPATTDYDRARQLEAEAWTTRQLLNALLLRLNHIHQPELYGRVERIAELSSRRHTRRSIATSVAMYRSMGWGAERVDRTHSYYADIVAALRADAQEVMA